MSSIIPPVPWLDRLPYRVFLTGSFVLLFDY